MKHIVKLVSILLIIACLLNLGACSKDKAGQVQEPAPSPAPTPSPGEQLKGRLRISELMGKNRSVYAAASGLFYDWVELENCSGEALSLKGLYLSDESGEPGWPLPEKELAAGERTVIFCGEGSGGADFALSCGETVYLLDNTGFELDRALCSSDSENVSLIRGEDGSFIQCRWPSPGFANDRQGYEGYAAERKPAGPVVINEAAVHNDSDKIHYAHEPCDWVEIKNISAEAVDLSLCHLSDDRSDYAKWQFPQVILQPGEIYAVACNKDEPVSYGDYCNTGFSLDAVSENLYLCYNKKLCDYVWLHDIPAGGSMGRMSGSEGFFYFADASPEAENPVGERAVAEAPFTLTPDGAYNGVESLSVELSGKGQIHYTCDGSVPTVNSPVYTEPVSISSTTIIRAICIEEGCLPSPVSTFSYIVNENHTLPLLSLVVDNASDFNAIYRSGRKYYDVPANLAFYDGEHSFNHACSVSMKGWTSLSLPKKSMGVEFKGVYGGNLECDVFGNGIDEYSSLSIRAGQDYTFAIFRNELFQQLALDASDHVLSQESKYCILYINGQYYGIYCLKEDFSKQYYASHAGVSRDSVEKAKTPEETSSAFYQELVQFCLSNDLAVDENYQKICSVLDIDSIIDWFIMEGYSANTDVQGNTRAFRSVENGNKWAFALYDLDWAFWYSSCDFTVILRSHGNAGYQLPPLMNSLVRNPDFRMKLLLRFAELNKSYLSNESVLGRIDQLQALLEPEVARDRQRWDLQLHWWYERVDELRAFVTDNNWEMHNIDQLCWLLNVSEEERLQIFGR